MWVRLSTRFVNVWLRKKPGVAPGFFVMMLMTPLTALAPHAAPPGPRTTSIRSMSSSMMGWALQLVPPQTGL